MNVDLKHPQAVITIKPTRLATPRKVWKEDDAAMPKQSYNVNLSLNKTNSTDQAKDSDEKLPPHILRLKARIEQLKLQIEEQQQKVQQITQDGTTDTEVIEAAKKQLISLQMELASSMNLLSEALKQANISDPGILLSAMA